MPDGSDEDLVADVLSDLAIGRFDDRHIPRASLIPFLKRVLEFDSRNRHRRRARQTPLTIEPPAPRSPDAWTLAFQLELRQATRRCIVCLPGELRRTVVRCLLRGWSTARAAEADGVPPATIRKRMERARRALRLKLWRYVRPGEGDDGA